MTDLADALRRAIESARSTTERCDVIDCGGRVVRNYRPDPDNPGDAEPAAYCSRCGRLRY